MVSPLEGQIAKAIYNGFKGRLKTGTLRRFSGSGVNALGDLVSSGSTDYTFTGIRETKESQFAGMQNQSEGAGIKTTRIEVLILLESISVLPQPDDYIYIESQWHQVRKVLERDPAGATTKLEVSEVKEPV